MVYFFTKKQQVIYRKEKHRPISKTRGLILIKKIIS
tara:strand:- start:204 stop:311 length:108 start_codon:yes stop_codon:yes gene_type:complete